MTFDRIIAILALLIALTGGVPTALRLLDQRLYFEILPRVPFKYLAKGGNFFVEIPVDIINSSEKEFSIFAIQYSVFDNSKVLNEKNSLTFWDGDDSIGKELPARLGPGDSFSIGIPIDYSFARALVSNETADKNPPEYYRDLFKNAYFPNADGLIEFARGACDRLVMANSLSRCIKLTAALSNKRVAAVGEFAVTFLPSKNADKL